jgi:hypothetical protein
MRALSSLLLGLLVSLPLQADVEVVSLQHRQSDEVMPALQPHLAEGGRLSGFGTRLFIDTSPDNLAQLRRILEALDRPPRQLQISVRQETDEERANAGLSVSGRIDAGDVRVRLPDTATGQGGGSLGLHDGKGVARARVWSSRDLANERIRQQVRVIEGSEAFIQAGVTLPLALREVTLDPYGAVIRESVVFEDIGTGFLARPTPAGDTVTLEIMPQHEKRVPGTRGTVRTQRLSTTVSGRLGEWIPLGGSISEDSGDARRFLSHSTADLRQHARILLKVDEVP